MVALCLPMPALGMPMPMPPDGAAPAPGAPVGPPDPLGEQAAAAASVIEARGMLEKAIGPFGAETEEGQAILKALDALGSIFPGPGAEAAPALAGGAAMTGPRPGGASLGF
jgi:hypothetical protein